MLVPPANFALTQDDIELIVNGLHPHLCEPDETDHSCSENPTLR
jgi:hypothetical protein